MSNLSELTIFSISLTEIIRHAHFFEINFGLIFLNIFTVLFMLPLVTPVVRFPSSKLITKYGEPTSGVPSKNNPANNHV